MTFVLSIRCVSSAIATAKSILPSPMARTNDANTSRHDGGHWHARRPAGSGRGPDARRQRLRRVLAQSRRRERPGPDARRSGSCGDAVLIALLRAVAGAHGANGTHSWPGRGAEPSHRGPRTQRLFRSVPRLLVSKRLSGCNGAVNRPCQAAREDPRRDAFRKGPWCAMMGVRESRSAAGHRASIAHRPGEV